MHLHQWRSIKAASYDWHRLRRILELPSPTITPSMISQAHIQQRVNGHYSRQDAVKLMEDITKLELGNIEQTAGMGRPTTVLRKRKLSELSDEQSELMFKKIKVDKSKYIC